MECPPDKDLNPNTNRCVKKCPDPEQTRNARFRCNPLKVPCKSNQYRHKKTGRCRTIKQKKPKVVLSSSSNRFKTPSSSLKSIKFKTPSSSSKSNRFKTPSHSPSLIFEDAIQNPASPLKKSSSSHKIATPDSPIPPLINYPYNEEEHALVPTKILKSSDKDVLVRRTPPPKPPKPPKSFMNKVSEFFFEKKKTTPSKSSSPIDRFSLTNRVYTPSPSKSKSKSKSKSPSEGKVENELLPEQKFDMFNEVKYKRDYDIFSEHFTGIEKLMRLYSWFSYAYGYNLNSAGRAKMYSEYREQEDKKEYLQDATNILLHFEFLSTWYNHFDPSKNTEDFIENILDKNPCYSRLYNRLYRKYVDQDWKDVQLYVSEPDDPDCRKK